MKTLFLVLGLFTAAAICSAEPYVVPEYSPPEIVRAKARTLSVFDALEADQGVAVDRKHFYAIDNTVIGKYEKESGKFIDRWIAPNKGLIRHLNSCFHSKKKLLCANSNYSLTPMASSVEMFSVSPLNHAESHSLGITDEGSFVWFDHVKQGYLAGFAHYSKKGGEPYKGNPYSSVVLLDKQWRRMGGWAYPDSLLSLMHPYSASGGAISKAGLLYVMGHDRPEMYVLAKPKMGPTLLHLATIDIEAEGQAFSFDPSNPDHVWVIDRKNKTVKQIELPNLNVNGSHTIPFN